MAIVPDTSEWILVRINCGIRPIDQWLVDNGLVFGQDYLISDYGVFADVRLRDHALVSAMILRWS